MYARKMLAAVVGAAVGVGLLGVLAPPAQAYGIQTVRSIGWAYTDSRLPDTPFVNTAGDLPIGAWAGTDGKTHKSRSYFTLDVSKFVGTVVHEADLIAFPSSRTDCAVVQPLELWRVEPITATTTWDNAPKQRELLGTLQAGCQENLSWDIVPALQNFAKRGERTLTVEIRVPHEVEADLAHGRKLVSSVTLDTMINNAPAVTRAGLDFPSWACGTARKPQPVGPRTYSLMIDIADPDSQDLLNGQFAAWPVGHEDQRVERTGTGLRNGSRVEWNMADYPHGTVLAWTGRAYDGHDYSDWTKPCYVVVDAEGPPAPQVSSVVYPNDGAAHGGPNLPATFTFQASGAKDVVGYYWGRDGETTTFIPAPKPGASVTLQYAPARSGSDALSVRSVDSADSRSPITTYEFDVRDTAPEVRVTMGGVGVPSRLAISSRFPGVTGFGYRIGAADEVKVPAVAGAADVAVVFPQPGPVTLEVRAYAGTEWLGAYKESVEVSDGPRIESTDFTFDHPGAIGQPGTFTFRPGRADVLAYEYQDSDGSWLRVEARADGTAVLTWTPGEGELFRTLRVRSVNADGSTSTVAEYSFQVEDTRPGVFSDSYPDFGASGGVGVPGEFFFGTSQPDVDAYLYQLNDGPELVADVEADNPADVSITPDRAGFNILKVRIRFLDGTFSPARNYVFEVA
ncbi:hypothetical protein AB0J74_04850 [Asanoa sp. NPDC049573]|uniref:hypothetical protein n=1 Tax=Asanoa sp. NPDC049573 TaxID=3155396 RepID=UPI00343A3F3B